MRRGRNHRFGLDDAVLVKDNHLALAGSVARAVELVRAASDLPIEVECETVDQVGEALEVGVDAILLDNMTLEKLREAVSLDGGPRAARGLGRREPRHGPRDRGDGRRRDLRRRAHSFGPLTRRLTGADMTAAQITTMQEEIRELAAERGAVILAHNYQVPEVQDVADFVGDSLGLSREAAATDADAIVFCGVHFMAETAAILSPQKTVLIPDLDAGCSLAASISAEQLRAWKAENPGAVVVSYVNTTAEVKAESDYCCTSGNAKGVIESIPEDTEILFFRTCSSGSGSRRSPGASCGSGWASATCTLASGHRTSRAGRRTRRTPSSSSTPSAAARASAWRSGTRRRTFSRPRG